MNEIDKNALAYLEKKALENTKVIDENIYHSVTQLNKSLEELAENKKKEIIYKKLIRAEINRQKYDDYRKLCGGWNIREEYKKEYKIYVKKCKQLKEQLKEANK